MTPRPLFDRIRSRFSASKPHAQQKVMPNRSGTTSGPVSAVELTPKVAALNEPNSVDESRPAPESSNQRGTREASSEKDLAAGQDEGSRYEPTTGSLPQSRLLTKAAEADTVYVDTAGLPNLRLTRINGQYALTVPDGRIVSPKSTSIYRYDLFIITVRGRAYYEDGNLATSTTAGTHLGLRRDPDNEHDINAIAVMDSSFVHQIGWVNKVNAKRLSKRMDSGESFAAVSLRGSP
ncbi:HIRAN domain-containing protein [Ornithinimicrobium sp. INDO-MA30-4]|uniref:HIRAN domain-containing protein n=1 Tax=Ornithinimicrobium sp. INDO-MA30-4 TaxID=2908651 RepID=UPI001F47B275|nr:HIRAN domain-containing protein [Ornithinimicrobium sp. INDO-MA30-4]UJH70060.1 HIRAN domain-containing protein [Ornithinimicrobium sp. INDO-MA30-4]